MKWGGVDRRVSSDEEDVAASAAEAEVHRAGEEDLPEQVTVGREHLNAGRYFPAHEAWETAWKQARETADAEFFKGLSQLGAGLVHLLRGNAHGCVRLLRRGAGRVRGYPPGHQGVDTRGVAEAAERLAAAVERGDVIPGDQARFDPPNV